MAFELFKSPKGKFHFRLKAKNNQIILASEGYNTKKNAENGVSSVKKHATSMKNFETKTAKDGRTYFVLKAKNGEVIGTSQMYKSRSGLRNGMSSVNRNCKSALKDLTAAKK